MSAQKINKKAQRRLRMVRIILVAIIAGIIFTAPKYILQIMDKYQEKQQLQENLDDLKEEQKTLEREVVQLSDTAYIARIARQKYLFSKNGEIIIKVDATNKEQKTKSTTSSFNLEIDNTYLIVGIAAIIFFVTIKKAKRKKHKTRHK